MPQLSRIRIYPIKSLDPLEVDESVVLPGGALRHDRRFALSGAGGQLINGKRNARVHSLRATFDRDCRAVTLSSGGESRVFNLDGDLAGLAAWFSRYFDQPVTILENSAAGIPDDTDAPGPTVVSDATLAEVASWFSPLSADETRLRFRANLEFNGVEPFWEDRLYSEVDIPVHFRIGQVELEGTNPCQRCVVPTRSPSNGEIWPGFAKHFEDRRFETLPYWATRSRFDHFYRLAVNTRVVPGKHGVIRVGDDVEIIGTR